MSRLLVLALLCCAPWRAEAQTPPTAPAQNSAEMSAHEAPATFRTKVNLVLIPVVVRDRQGRAIGDLQKEDFQVFDRRKPQVITSFAVEKSGSTNAPETPAGAKAAEAPEGETPAPVVPLHFIAYLFDDVHLSFEDLAHARDAAARHLDSTLRDLDRAAIFTTSGRTTLDFTADHGRLHETLMQLRPAPIARSGIQECPDVSYYQADLILNRSDNGALEAAGEDALTCLNLDQTKLTQAMLAARATASRVLSAGDHETRVSLGIVREVVRRMSVMPGQRSVILVSPGFLVLFDHRPDETEILDRAIHANVIISALNARGLYVNVPGGEASQRGPQNSQTLPLKSTYQIATAQAEEDVLAELANGTGGEYFHNSNALGEGFKRLAAPPEYLYVLGIAPQNLKLDGKFHELKIILKEPSKLTLQARRGYYAPKHLADPEETAKQEIEDAMFSREELRDIPVEMHTQFFKASEDSAHLAVLVHVDVKHIPFRKEAGRNRDDLTVVAGLFDRNGNFVAGNQKKVELRLKDPTLEKSLTTGLTVKNEFDVKPGSYAVRLVVRDSEGQLMAAANGAVEIP